MRFFVRTQNVAGITSLTVSERGGGEGKILFVEKLILHEACHRSPLFRHPLSRPNCVSISSIPFSAPLSVYSFSCTYIYLFAHPTLELNYTPARGGWETRSRNQARGAPQRGHRFVSRFPFSFFFFSLFYFAPHLGTTVISRRRATATRRWTLTRFVPSILFRCDRERLRDLVPGHFEWSRARGREEIR